MKHINLLIFDECHHGRRDHPMHQLMKRYNTTNQCDRPRVIGLTGMLVSGSVKPSTLIPDLEALENTFHATIATVNNMNEFNNVLIFSTNPNESVVQFAPITTLPIMDRLETFVDRLVSQILTWQVDETHQRVAKNQLRSLPNPVKHLKLLLKDFVYQMKDTGDLQWNFLLNF